MSDEAQRFDLWVGEQPIEAVGALLGALCITAESVHALVDEETRHHRVIGHPEGREQLRRLIRRFADALHAGLTEPASDRLVFREGIGFLLETEMFWHWPIRHLARRLARRTPRERSFAIELPGRALQYGLLWDDNDLWPLTVASELARRGRRAVLYLRANPSEPLDAIEIAPARNLAREARTARDRLADALTAVVPCRHVVCPQTMRTARQIVKQLPRHVRLMNGLDRSRPQLRWDITPLRDEIGAERLRLAPAGSPAPGFTAYRGEWPRAGLARQIAARLDRAIAAAYRKAERIVRWRRVSRFDTADHLSLEAGAFAVAVSRRGGAVQLWSHASSPIALDYRAPTFDAVVAPTNLAAQAWRTRFPSVSVTVAPRTVLPPFTLDAPRDASGVVTLVMFGIRGSLGAMPRFYFAAHEASLRRLVDALARSEGVRLVYKSKLEPDLAWWASRIDPGGFAQISGESHATMSWPNMVFASPTIASTALLEAICRGVPAVLLRGTPAWDHVPLDPRVIPIEDAEPLAATLQRLRDAERYAALAAEQEAWLRSILSEESAPLAPQPSRSTRSAASRHSLA